MDDFLGKVKEQAAWAKDEAAKLGKQVYEKTNNVIGKTKISFAISETDSKIKDVYSEIGKLVYERYAAGEDICEFAKESCEKIEALLKEKADLNEKLAELKETVKCAGCGKNNAADASYCSGCGSKLDVTRKNGGIEFEDEPIAVYSEDICTDADTAEVSDDDSVELKKVKKVVTIKAKKPEDE